MESSCKGWLVVAFTSYFFPFFYAHTPMSYYFTLLLFVTLIQADILVSELLGSWGDNELSPVSFVWVISIIAISGFSVKK